MTTERIVITFHEDGSFRGASAADFGELPIPLDAAQLTALAPNLNTALLATIDELNAKLASQLQP